MKLKKKAFASNDVLFHFLMDGSVCVRGGGGGGGGGRGSGGQNIIPYYIDTLLD